MCVVFLGPLSEDLSKCTIGKYHICIKDKLKEFHMSKGQTEGMCLIYLIKDKLREYALYMHKGQRECYMCIDTLREYALYMHKGQRECHMCIDTMREYVRQLLNCCKNDAKDLQFIITKH